MRMAPASWHQARSLGIDPSRKKLILVKAVIAPRAAYTPIAATFLLADTPGATSADFTRLPYRRRRYPMFGSSPMPGSMVINGRLTTLGSESVADMNCLVICRPEISRYRV